jgi:hypothetical protein
MIRTSLLELTHFRTSLSRVRLDLHDIHILVDQLTTQNASLEANLHKHSEGMSIITDRLNSLHDKLDLVDNSRSLTTFVAKERRAVPCLAYDASLGSSSSDNYAARKLLDSCKDPDASGVAVRTFSSSKRRCKPGCTCVCHRRKTFKSTRFLDALIGALFIGYSAQAARKLGRISTVWPRWLRMRRLRAS